ncbi:sec1 family domain-containing protein 2-like isoform X1 [Cataglyphis hispanica]|uniref:sec1 family domain-containing protein 2-like isoform X1 n=1 Tax=Cataglyphis hispanica TaxID=1086592 RepID=UPI002180939A|nr:sec1 family domain-containing protein 2-like isoform X1 [Cataglyphis hispanica]XP_050462922.1 sec1 family domain-containing protein 2-like isoform X1 [Cataglyphis hispanica]
MENVSYLERFLADTWHDIANLVRESAVYIDHAATECLHWHTGGRMYSFLKDAGAVSVYELTMYNFRYVKVQNCKKATIISTSTNPAFYQRTVKMIMEKNAFNYCTIVTAAHPTILSYDDAVSLEDRVDYIKLKRDVKSWMSFNQQSQDCLVTILFRPIFITSIDDGLFVTPPFGDLLSPLNSELPKISECAVDHLVSLFNSLFAYLNLKEDIYSMGKFSEYVAEKLETLPAAVNRRNNSMGIKRKGVSLIFIDRALDLCTPTSNNTESLLARILCTLPHLPHHCNDVTINMSSLFCGSQELFEVPGCLAAGSKDKNLTSILITKKQKEVLITMNKILIDIFPTKENVKPKLATRISARSLEKFVNKFKDIDNLRAITESSKELQVVLGIIQALTSEKTSQLDLLISLEKLVLQNIAISRDSTSVLGQFSNIIRTREKRGLDTDNILALLVHIYALAGNEIKFSPQQEQQLKEAITDAVFEDIVKLNKNPVNNKMSVYQQTLLLIGVADDQSTKGTSAKVAERIMNILHEIAQQRAFLQDYTSLMSKSSSQEIVQRVGILQQLSADIFHPDRYEIPDLQQRSLSLLSAGFNLFSKGRAKHHPCDNDWVIIYIIGGITPEEVKEAKENISLFNPNCQITLAGSRLLNPLDIVDKYLLSLIDY